MYDSAAEGEVRDEDCDKDNEGNAHENEHLNVFGTQRGDDREKLVPQRCSHRSVFRRRIRCGSERRTKHSSFYLSQPMRPLFFAASGSFLTPVEANSRADA